jgi:hypothetical protein
VQAIGHRCVLSAAHSILHLTLKILSSGIRQRHSLVATDKLQRYVLRPSSGCRQILHEALDLKPRTVRPE